VRRIELTDTEIQVLADLMNAGVKALGLQSVKNAAYLLGKLENAEEVKEDDPATDE